MATTETKNAKFAGKKKGHLIVDLDKAKLTVVGENDPAPKKAKAAKAEKPAKEVKAKKAEKPAKEAKAKKAEPTERRSAIADMKIKVLQKAHGAREGTKRAAWMDALVSSKTVGEAQGKAEGLDSSVVRFAEEAGIISLS